MDLSKLNVAATSATRVSSCPDRASSDGANTDSGSHIAEKGGLSDPNFSDDDCKLPSDFGSSSTLPKLESVLEVCDTQQLLGSAQMSDISDEVVGSNSPGLLADGSVGVYADNVSPAPEVRAFLGGLFVTSEVRISEMAAASSTPPIDKSASDGMVDREEVKKEERNEKGDTPAGCEEELLEILKKWYILGYGEKHDLVRALRLTGNESCADK